MEFIDVKETPEFSLKVIKWNRKTKASGEEMAKEVIEPLLNNDNYLDKNKADVNHTHDDMTAATADKNGKAGLVPAPDAGSADRYLRSDGTWHKPPNDNTTYGNMSGATASAAGKAGLVPAPAKGNADRYLRSDGTWQKPPNDNTTYSNMTAATVNAAGRAGLVPAPAAGAQGKYLRGDGTWQTPPDTNTTYGAATQSAAGLMSAADKKKLDEVASGANVTPSGLMSGYVRTGRKAGTTIGQYATASGNDTTASGYAAHTEGESTTASGERSHAEGHSTTASDLSAHAEGTGSEATGRYSHAEGGTTIASSSASHSEGWYTTASGPHSHSEGKETTASGENSHAEGNNTTASGNNSHAGGSGTIASSYAQTAIGYYNVQYGTSANSINSYFIVGNGSSSARSNAFRVHYDGAAYGKKAYNTSGADYAEYFEWLDGNPETEDRRGYFVTLNGDKIRIANSTDDYILGVISGRPSVIGNSDPDDWHGHFLVDDFGDFIIEKVIEKRKEYHVEEIEETYLDEDGTEKVRLVPQMVEDEIEEEVDSYVLNPDYDPDRPYAPRSERPEWAAVGMLGVLLVRDDGTCQVNSYCKTTDSGVATASETGWRVIARMNEHLVKIVFR